MAQHGAHAAFPPKPTSMNQPATKSRLHIPQNHRKAGPDLEKVQAIAHPSPSASEWSGSHIARRNIGQDDARSACQSAPRPPLAANRRCTTAMEAKGPNAKCHATFFLCNAKTSTLPAAPGLHPAIE